MSLTAIAEKVERERSADVGLFERVVSLSLRHGLDADCPLRDLSLRPELLRSVSGDYRIGLSAFNPVERRMETVSYVLGEPHLWRMAEKGRSWTIRRVSVLALMMARRLERQWER